MSQAAFVESRKFREALGTFTTGVTIVTTCSASGENIGLTANSFNSVSLDPPLVLWSLAKSSLSLPAFIESEHFAVHILASDQQALSDRFARRGSDKFTDLQFERGEGNAPLIAGCASRFQCRKRFCYEGGDHVILVGEVVEFEHAERAPLIFHRGRYGYVFTPPKEAAAQQGEQPQERGFQNEVLPFLARLVNNRLFLRLRQHYTRLGLTEMDYSVLGLLGRKTERSLAELRAITSAIYQPATEATIANLVRMELVHGEGEGDALRVRLTERGMNLVLELMAIAKSVEVDATQDLDETELAILKNLLSRVARTTSQWLPGAWREEAQHASERRSPQ